MENTQRLTNTEKGKIDVSLSERNKGKAIHVTGRGGP
jgi:hypothetical protein